MRKLGLLFGLVLLSFSSKLYAQAPEEKPVSESGLFRNSVFIELAGNAAVLSINYERMFPLATPGKTLVLRAGTFLAPYGIKRNNFSYELFLPLEASVLSGKRAVKFEVGFGATLHSYFDTYVNTEGERIHYSKNEIFPIMRIGGRWQKPGKHWFVKVAATPFLEGNYFGMDLPVSPWAGISVGYNFWKKKK